MIDISRWIQPLRLIVTFIRHHPNMRVGRSFLIQILKFGREARYCPSRGLKPQRPSTGSLAEYVKAVIASGFAFGYDPTGRSVYFIGFFKA